MMLLVYLKFTFKCVLSDFMTRFQGSVTLCVAQIIVLL